jgi:uncharacterized membrane protein (UPF0136 family)
MITLIIAIFISSIVSEILWVLTVRRATQGDGLQTAMFGSLIVLVNGFMFVSYVRNPILIIVAGIGTFIGSYFTVKVDKE